MRTAVLRLKAGLVPVEQITGSILVLRGHRVLLDSNLADLYDVATKVLLQAVKRNIQCFPEDFMMQLTAAERAVLRSQFVTSKTSRGGRRYLPFAFTEQGVAMLSSVLGSERALTAILSAIRELMNPPAPKRKSVGFTANLNEKS
jgi:hypothetical protein